MEQIVCEGCCVQNNEDSNLVGAEEGELRDTELRFTRIGIEGIWHKDQYELRLWRHGNLLSGRNLLK